MRLLSFLTAIERSLSIDEPSPRAGTWDNTRTINYHQRLARLTLSAKEGGASAPLGTILLQSFGLADGSTCLKSFLRWKDNPVEVVHAIYEKPETNWEAEARAVAAIWLNGLETSSSETELSLAKAG